MKTINGSVLLALNERARVLSQQHDMDDDKRRSLKLPNLAVQTPHDSQIGVVD